MAMTSAGKRSWTGRHTLLPANQGRNAPVVIPLVADRTFVSWTFGRATVIWRVWPAVALHTAFAALVVWLSMRTTVRLEVPPVLLTVLGVVIGFVISYRALSGYDRYWTGRSYWTDVIRNVRMLSRFIWFHVPCRLSPLTEEEMRTGVKRSEAEMRRVMKEKKMALDLLEGFCVSLKHHLRGEMGIYYEDLYHFMRPLHSHSRIHFHFHRNGTDLDHENPDGGMSTTNSPDQARPPIYTPDHSEAHLSHRAPSTSQHVREDTSLTFADPVIPPMNTYGTFNPDRVTTFRHHSQASHGSLGSDSSSDTDTDSDEEVDETHRHRRRERRRRRLGYLLPGHAPRPGGFWSKVSKDLIPFESVFSAIGNFFTGWGRRKNEPLLPGNEASGSQSQQKWAINAANERWTHAKHRPRVAGGGENLPLEAIWCLSEWFSVLEERNVVPGTSMGTMNAWLGNLDDSLAGLEKILTTPLPFVFSAHISTVWIYLFFLPFQLLGEFGWYTIPGVSIASFIYLGFLAVGEEIEQPFGYDENDLDLDLFSKEIVHAELDRLKKRPSPNNFLGKVDQETLVDVGKTKYTRVSQVFGPVDE